mgnify:CR=1 FL=1
MNRAGDHTKEKAAAAKQTKKATGKTHETRDTNSAQKTSGKSDHHNKNKTKT